MAVVLTKFGSGTPFGSPTKFGGYEDTSDAISSDAIADFNNILLERGKVFSVVENSATKDTLGDVSALASTTKRVYAVVMDITQKDRQIADFGLARTGDMKGFFKAEYTTTSAGVDTTFEVKEGDILKDTNGKNWRIIKIVGERRIMSTIIFKSTILRNIDLKATGE